MTPTVTDPKAAAKGLLDTLTRAEVHHDGARRNARELAKVGIKIQRRIQKALPGLAARAESAVGEERGPAFREYLAAVQDGHRAEQAFQLARRQRVILGLVGNPGDVGESGDES